LIYNDIEVFDRHLNIKCSFKYDKLNCILKNTNKYDTIFLNTMYSVSKIGSPNNLSYKLSNTGYTSTSLNFPMQGEIILPNDSIILDFPIEFKNALISNKQIAGFIFEFDYIIWHNKQFEKGKVMKLEYMLNPKLLSFALKLPKQTE
jgi:hypothetical protein